MTAARLVVVDLVLVTSSVAAVEIVVCKYAEQNEDALDVYLVKLLITVLTKAQFTARGSRSASRAGAPVTKPAESRAEPKTSLLNMVSLENISGRPCQSTFARCALVKGLLYSASVVSSL